MNIITAIPCLKMPSLDHIRGVAEAAMSTIIVLSISNDDHSAAPEIEGVDIHVTDHKNFMPTGASTDAIDRIRWYANEIAAPLARLASTFSAADDAILWLHDSVPGQPAFAKLLAKIIKYPHLAFVSAAERTRPWMPEYRDRSDLCLAWTQPSFVKYATRSIPATQEIKETSLVALMETMDADKKPYLWTNIQAHETFHRPPPPTP